MEIRHLQKSDDIYAVSKIYERSWKFAYSGIIPQSYLDSITPDNWVKNILKPGRYSLVMVENGEYIGTASYSQSRIAKYPGWGEIISLYLLPKYIGRGYGKQLLNAAVAELAKLGNQMIFLWVLEENTKARAFYEKVGFVLSSEYLDDNIGGKKLREIQYSICIR